MSGLLSLPEPRELGILRTSPDIPIGSQIPAKLRAFRLPLDVIVHVECIGCRLKPPADLEAALSRPSVLNLVLAADFYEYRQLAARTGARLVKGDSEMVGELHAAFGPRLYRFDSAGRLYYVQGTQPADYGEYLHEVLDK